MKFKVFRFKKVKSTNNTAIRIIRNSKLESGMIISDLQSNLVKEFNSIIYNLMTLLSSKDPTQVHPVKQLLSMENLNLKMNLNLLL